MIKPHHFSLKTFSPFFVNSCYEITCYLVTRNLIFFCGEKNDFPKEKKIVVRVVFFFFFNLRDKKIYNYKYIFQITFNYQHFFFLQKCTENFSCFFPKPLRTNSNKAIAIRSIKETCERVHNYGSKINFVGTVDIGTKGKSFQSDVLNYSLLLL